MAGRKYTKQPTQIILDPWTSVEQNEIKV